MLRHLRTIFLLCAAACCVGRAQTVTFNEHIAPIIYGNCSKCHHPGEVAPFSLLSYDDVATHARTIVTVTQSRFMPPWKPEPGWAAYRDERRLTAAQISLIRQWVEGGMPRGDVDLSRGPSGGSACTSRRIAVERPRRASSCGRTNRPPASGGPSISQVSAISVSRRCVSRRVTRASSRPT